MAEEETKEDSKDQKKKSNKLLIISIISVLVLIIIGGAVATFLLLSEEEPANPQQQQQQQQEASAQTQQKSSSYRSTRDSDEMESRKLSDIGVLYPLDTFTVNLKSDAGRRYLKATISLELNGKELSVELDNKSPVIRDRIIRILSSKTLEEISSKKGKQKVSEQIVDTLNSMITDGNVKSIYFTEFVIQ